jgi:hypothetical protein
LRPVIGSAWGGEIAVCARRRFADQVGGVVANTTRCEAAAVEQTQSEASISDALADAANWRLTNMGFVLCEVEDRSLPMVNPQDCQMVKTALIQQS